MSRIGKNPIQISEGVTVNINGSKIDVSGLKGNLAIDVRDEIEVKIEDGYVVCSIRKETKESNAYWGLTRSLIANMIEGVSKGYEKKLEIIGVGYRAKQNGSDGVVINIGYSHPVEFKAPEGVEIKVEDNTHLTISGIDKQLVGLTAAKIRKIRKPEPYKGKGIRYEDEIVRRKAGKAGKVGNV